MFEGPVHSIILALIFGGGLGVGVRVAGNWVQFCGIVWRYIGKVQSSCTRIDYLTKTLISFVNLFVNSSAIIPYFFKQSSHD